MKNKICNIRVSANDGDLSNGLTEEHLRILALHTAKEFSSKLAELTIKLEKLKEESKDRESHF